MVDHSHAGPLEPPPHPLTFEARIVLPPRQLVHVTFQANLHGVEIGEACLFHLTQSSLQDVVEGGLTVAMVRL